MVLFTKYSMDADKTIALRNLLPLRYVFRPTKKGRTCNMQGYWDPHISVAVVMELGVIVEEALSDIIMNATRAVDHL